MCARCAVDAPSFEEARAVYVNDGELRELLLSFKYAGALHLAGTFAGMMAEAVRENRHWFGGRECLLVPVPMHRLKLVRRGYNQAEELAVLLGKELGWAVSRVLKRLPDRMPQASLAREQRLRHARKIYAVHESRLKRRPVRGRDILLVDDVFTTGATADACSRLLFRAGASSVCVLTLARTHHAWHG
jgi:Predicted amidophosphoribosyltransferases